jgi:hypothetical protein
MDAGRSVRDRPSTCKLADIQAPRFPSKKETFCAFKPKHVIFSSVSFPRLAILLALTHQLKYESGKKTTSMLQVTAIGLDLIKAMDPDFAPTPIVMAKTDDTNRPRFEPKDAIMRMVER